jgi:hypothetical protein
MATVTYVPQQVVQQATLIAWIIGLGAVTPEALAEREQLPTALARERLDEITNLGFLESNSVLVGYSPLYVVTAAGRMFARKHQDAGGYAYPKGLRKCRVAIREARHTIACAGVMAALERRYPGHRVIGERELHRDERELGCRLATIEIPGVGARRSHSPDIVIWPPATPEMPSPLPVAVEVELTSKWREILIENCRAWAQCGYIEAVLYFAETRKIEEQLLDAIEELRAEEGVVVNLLSGILKPQPGFDLTDD